MRRKTYIFPVGIGFWSQEISKALALTFIGLLFVLVTWYTISSSERSIEDLRASSIIRLDMQKELQKY